ncbi:hypothetical protein [Glycomyces xiaoerkulensis]|uniref:hypothetical protein n=1 Tax=Glycomyces xiaoerkulensis TaxID=2038139 RepID=UPI000C269D25|nr:hypothetical protein [Glycomyces xiaoerkulensis]
MTDSTADRREAAKSAITALERQLGRFTRGTEGTAVSHDGTVWVRTRINGDCRVRLRPRESDADE